MFVCLFVFYLEYFLQGGQQCWALWAFLATCRCTLFIDIISLFINWANKDACLLDSEVTFRRELGSTKILPTRPGVDPLEVTRPMPDLSGISQSPMIASPSVIARSQSGSVPPSASYVFGLQPEVWSTPDQPTVDPTSLH